MYFNKGASGLTFYNSAHRSREYETPTKVCCSFCRSPIMDEGRRVCLIFPESIDFGDSPEEKLEWRKAFEVSCHIFYEERVLEILDGKTKWAGIDNNSEMLDDLGNPKGEEDRVHSLE
ncbi:hypothetical protein PHISCL_00222 [Aspergillus sclerotialis]|uniref:CENP-V/GFA domain-containing protein n=1 Tax=Aspergillus sclerotialis TaxID=2070753 RepID=A0A3A2ZWG3_9EURO|nr:hypothetical protein PHISCL_00222 [Aspergillus sclerotialis]